MSDNQRKTQRFNVKVPVVFFLDGVEHKAESVNMSLGGMFVTTAEEIPFGAKVQVQFSIPAMDEPIKVEATVRWVDAGTGIGLQFAALRAKAVWALQKVFGDSTPTSD